MAYPAFDFVSVAAVVVFVIILFIFGLARAPLFFDHLLPFAIYVEKDLSTSTQISHELDLEKRSELAARFEPVTFGLLSHHFLASTAV